MIRGVVARLRSFWKGVREPADVDAADMDNEFGSTEDLKGRARAARGLKAFDSLRVSWIDFRLGFRMLMRYPGLTLIGGAAIAFAITVGGGTFELISQALSPTLPLPEGDRVVAVELRNVRSNRSEPRLLHELDAWRADASALEELGAFRIAGRNLTVGADGRSEPVNVAEIDAAAFGAARTGPLLGRGLVEADDAPSAPPVIVLSHSVWQARFFADPDIVGRTVRVGREEHTVIGVMPEGFGYPIAQKAWVPLRVNAVEYPVGEGPVLSGVVGRLAPGTSMEQAQAQLDAIAARRSAEFRSTHEHLRPRIRPLAEPLVAGSMQAAAGWSINIFLVLLMLLVCSNVALLMFARAASRDTELTVRAALGASRARLVTQFFAEALVLGAAGALLGVALLRFGVQWVITSGAFGSAEGMPFWIRAQVSPLTLAYIVALTLIGAIVAGVVPGLKATRGLGERLKAIGAGGTGPRFGGVWTAVIVTQVALTLAFPAMTYFVHGDIRKLRATEIGVPKDRYLTSRITVDARATSEAQRETRAELAARVDAAAGELMRRLRADGQVASVTLAERLPLTYHPHRIVELDEGPAAPRNINWPDGYRVSDAAVEVEFFETFGARALAGQTFRSSDYVPGQRSVVVNAAFVKLVMGGRSPIGRRVRYVDREEREGPKPEPGPWYEIIGVVPNLAMAVGADTGSLRAHDPKQAGIYHPLRAATVGPLSMAIRFAPGVDPDAYRPTLHALADAADPALQLQKVMSFEQITESEAEAIALWVDLLLVVSAVALLLSLAGIYAVMSFTVARRTREIGVRMALGSTRVAVIVAVLRRPIIQVAWGIIGGAVLVAMLSGSVRTDGLRVREVGWVAVYAMFMTCVCALACIVPARHAMRVQPADALRVDG